MNRIDRIAEIEAASAKRDLTDEELDELERLRKWRDIRLTRLPRRIDACHAKLARLHSELAALT